MQSNFPPCMFTETGSGPRISKKLNSASHLLGADHACQHHEVKNDPPEPPLLGRPEDDAGMCRTCGGQRKEIAVACDEDTPLRECECGLLQIRDASKPLVQRCRHIDAALSESGGDGRVDVLVEVVFDHHPGILWGAIAPRSIKQTRARPGLQL